jgi:hypothetical protein
MIYRIIKKITANTEYPAYLIPGKIGLLGHDTTFDKQFVYNYIQAEWFMFNKKTDTGLKRRNGKWLISDSSDDGYLVLIFTDKSECDDIFNSPKMIEYSTAKDKVFSKTGWLDFGFRTITAIRPEYDSFETLPFTIDYLLAVSYWDTGISYPN